MKHSRHFKEKTDILFQRLAGNLHYVGLVLVAWLMMQAQNSTQVSEKTLNDSVNQQDELRDILWVNLLTQRAEVLALSQFVTGDASSRERAIDILRSIPSLVHPGYADVTQAEQKLLDQARATENLFQALKKEPGFSKALPSSNPYHPLLRGIEKLGAELNEEESRQWYALLDKNRRLLKDFGDHRRNAYVTYALFIFYLGFLGWLSSRKARAERRVQSLSKSSFALKLEKEAAEKSNQAKSLFLANVSHELRTPMHGVLSFARFGQQKIDSVPKEKLKTYFDEIYESGSRLMSLLNDLLDLSKLEAGKIVYSMTETDLVGLLGTVASEMRAFAEEKGVRIEVSSRAAELVGVFDQERVMQVARNLLSNAIKFSDKGSKIRVDFAEIGDKVSFRVSNRGVEIPQAELTLVFDKFVQSSKTRTGAGGTGLGLAICKEIVEQHGGKIWAESLNGETKFTVELPVASAVREAA